MAVLFGSPFDWVSFGVWSIIAYTTALGLYIPIWRSQWWKAWGREGKERSTRLTGRGRTRAMRHLLLYPPLWNNGLLWVPAFTLSAVSITLVLKKGRDSEMAVTDDSASSPLMEVAVLLWFVQMWVHGIWTLYFFYWALPLWSILHLMVSGVLGVAYAAVAGSVALASLWFYLPVLILTWVTALANLLIYLVCTSPLVVGNPLAMWLERGFNPVPWPIYHYELVHAARRR